jgi:hypothetical protein
MPTKALERYERKRLKLSELPPRPPTIDLKLLNEVARANFIAQLSDDPTTWFRGRRCLKGMPWWLEVPSPYLNENQMRLTYSMSHAEFVDLHDSGVIPGADFLPASGELRKDVRIVWVEDLLARVVIDGKDWFLRRERVPEIGADGVKRGRKKGKPPARTRQIDITREQFLSLFGSDSKKRYRVPMDVALVRMHDADGRFLGSASFDGRGKVDTVYGVDPDVSNYVDLTDYVPIERESDPE